VTACIVFNCVLPVFNKEYDDDDDDDDDDDIIKYICGICSRFAGLILAFCVIFVITKLLARACQWWLSIQPLAANPCVSVPQVMLCLIWFVQQ